MATHSEVHEQHEKEMANLIEMQREDLRHDCGTSAYDNRIGSMIEQSIYVTLAWAATYSASAELVEDFIDHAWRRVREETGI